MEKNGKSNLQQKYGAEWRHYYTGQNLRSVRIACVVSISLNVLIRILATIFPDRVTHRADYPAFDISNWIFIAAGTVFLIAAFYLSKDFKRNPVFTIAKSTFTFVFCLYYIGCGIFCSYFPTGNPGDNFIMLLIGLIMTALLLVFEAYETVMLMLATEIMIILVLLISNLSLTQILYNQLVCLVTLAGFYLASRYLSHYRATFFMQVQEIKEKNAEIERNSEFKSQVLGMVAHDLRNPIGAVETITTMMNEDISDPDMSYNLELIKASCKQARTIIDDLLDSVRNENPGNYVIVDTEMTGFLEKCVVRWSGQACGKTIALTCRTTEVHALLNEDKFQRVIDNLVGNALKFSCAGTRIELLLTREKKEIVIQVRDHGIGIPPEHLPAIFDRFGKAGRKGLNGETSTGLGLNIVKQIVEKHGGTIAVKSKVGEGSVFTIRLPEVPQTPVLV